VRFTVNGRLLGLLAATALGVGTQAACGGNDSESAPRAAAAETPAATTSPRPHGPIPPALRGVESAAEDTIDFALAGQRPDATRSARALRAAAHGPAAEALREAGVSAADIAEFRTRADRVARLAPEGDLLRLALASNQAFAMVPAFFARYENPIPANVMLLDYLDFEAKLRAEAGDAAAVRIAVARLDRTWRGLREGVVQAGGTQAAHAFDAHVARMRRLAAVGAAGAAAVREAQHGLDLVDEVEGVYEG
jgi:hypothetical protein